MAHTNHGDGDKHDVHINGDGDHHVTIGIPCYNCVNVILTVHDEDNTSTSTPAAPSPTPALAAPSSAPPSGLITRARAREFNFNMMLKNEGPKD
jgi:hypothetical protein